MSPSQSQLTRLGDSCRLPVPHVTSPSRPRPPRDLPDHMPHLPRRWAGLPSVSLPRAPGAQTPPPGVRLCPGTSRPCGSPLQPHVAAAPSPSLVLPANATGLCLCWTCLCRGGRVSHQTTQAVVTASPAAQTHGRKWGALSLLTRVTV